MMKNIGLLLLVVVTLIQPARAALSPVAISIIPPIQLPPERFTVVGARVSALWGSHQKVYGLDVGVIGNVTTQSFVGTSVSGIFNYTVDSSTIVGAQIAGIANVNRAKSRIVGVQLALGLNSNQGESWLLGLDVAPVNYAPHMAIYGVQLGLFNRALEIVGLQIGLINVVHDLHGIQIGILNFNDSGPFEISPAINIGF